MDVFAVGRIGVRRATERVLEPLHQVVGEQFCVGIGQLGADDSGIAHTEPTEGEYDEAYDQTKLVRRHFPDNKYVLELLDALTRDWARSPA